MMQLGLCVCQAPNVSNSCSVSHVHPDGHTVLNPAALLYSTDPPPTPLSPHPHPTQVLCAVWGGGGRGGGALRSCQQNPWPGMDHLDLHYVNACNVNEHWGMIWRIDVWFEPIRSDILDQCWKRDSIIHLCIIWALLFTQGGLKGWVKHRPLNGWLAAQSKYYKTDQSKGG